jgi:hypothetical protein
MAVAAVAASIAAVGAAPAHASATECGPAIKPICDAVGRQIDNVKTEAEAASDYVLYWGDIVVTAVNDTYYTVRCTVLEECS